MAASTGLVIMPPPSARISTAAKASILALCKNPEAAALMAGEYAKSTQGTMRALLGRQVFGGEL